MSEQYESYHLHLRDGCPYCDLALDLVKEKKVEYYAWIHEKGSENLTEQQDKWSHHTVPVVLRCVTRFEKDREFILIGGYTELKEYFESREI